MMPETAIRAPAAAASELASERPVAISCAAGAFLTGAFAAPPSPRAAVVIANDRGCARHVASLRVLSGELRDQGYATLLVDVLRAEEQEWPSVAADLRQRSGLLARRISCARDWLLRSPAGSLPVVLLGLGRAAPAALLSAAERPGGVVAVIACGPNPDAAGAAVAFVRAPALLLAHGGSFDELPAHLRALQHLRGGRQLIALQPLDDPMKRTLDVAHAVEAFLAPLCREPRDAA